MSALAFASMISFNGRVNIEFLKRYHSQNNNSTSLKKKSPGDTGV